MEQEAANDGGEEDEDEDEDGVAAEAPGDGVTSSPSCDPWKSRGC